MYVERIERPVEDLLARRRRENEARRDRKARRDDAQRRAQAYAPGPHRRPIAGELVDDLVVRMADVLRRAGRWSQ
jgi:hypothetical protein